MLALPRALHEENRRSWNEATRAHNSHKGDQAAFLRGGGTTLKREEIELLGDLAGARVVHLQCNAGQDTLGLARLGAEVTGVNISDEAIEFAAALSRDAGIPAAFVRSDVYDWLAAAPGPFDVAFGSYGAVNWLSDLGLWARGVAGALRPGGRFVTVEFHPFSMMFDEHRVLKYPGQGGAHYRWDVGVGDYVAASGDGLVHGAPYQEGVKDFKNSTPCHEFAWSVAEIISALLAAGLRLEVYREYDYSNGFKLFADMNYADGRWTQKQGPALPLMYGLVFRKDSCLGGVGEGREGTPPA